MRWGMVALAIVVVAAAAVMNAADQEAPILDAVAGVAFLAAGVAAAGRRGTGRWAALTYLGGLAWFAADLVGPLAFLHRPLLAHAALAYPDGRLRCWLQRVAVAGAWISVVLVPDGVGAVVTIVVGVGIAAAAVVGALRSSAVRRRAASVGAAAGVLLGIAVAGPVAVRAGAPVTSYADMVTTGHLAAVTAAGAVLLLATLLRTGTGRDVADTVVDLAEVGSPRFTAMVDDLREGREPADDLADPALRSVIATAVDLLDANQSLQGELAAQAEQVRGSRRRLVEAADAERRRLERGLADRVGWRLDELGETIAGVAADPGAVPAKALLMRAVDEVAATRDDLSQLARGLHPRILVEHGLHAALDDLAARAGLPTSVRAPDTRFPATVETTLWYVCAEAVTNVAKHARASAATIEIALDGTDVVATVADDGIGGARPGSGSGLRGLADRLDAVGGGLEIDGSVGGTRVRARVPLS